jgi:hypothetical protein
LIEIELFDIIFIKFYVDISLWIRMRTRIKILINSDKKCSNNVIGQYEYKMLAWTLFNKLERKIYFTLKIMLILKL